MALQYLNNQRMSKVSTYGVWVKPGNGMMYNIECNVYEADFGDFVANTDSFEDERNAAGLLGFGETEEEAVHDLKFKLERA